MESVEQEGFKHIPLRCYYDVNIIKLHLSFIDIPYLDRKIFSQDGTYFQKLITPLTEKGQKKTLQDLLSEFSTPVQKAGKQMHLTF